MRLGVVLTGIGACAAASAGALTWLLDAGVAPYAVCGMQAAAWPAALYLVGYDADRLRGAAVQAARAGRRLLTADASARDVLGIKKARSAGEGGLKSCWPPRRESARWGFANGRACFSAVRRAAATSLPFARRA